MRSNHVVLRLAIVILVGLLAGISAQAQTATGRILGNIADQSGAVVKGANVTITDASRGTSRTLTTDDAGAYLAPDLAPSTYNVKVEAAGFKTVERRAIELQVATDVRIDVALQPGQTTEVVVVTGELPQVDTTNDVLGGTLSNKQINDMPLNGRDFLNLVVLQPGIQRYPGGGHYSVSSNGVRPEDNNFIIDGYDSNDPYGAQSVINGVGVQGSPATILPIDAIQEFNVEENPEAEFGWKPGAIVNVGLKSGTNALHGTAYDFERNSAVDARNYFNTTGPQKPVRLHQFGATVGGPIIKDKLFFFGGWEAIHDLVGNTFTVPSPATVPLATPASGGNCTYIPSGDCVNSIPNAIADLQAGGFALNPISQRLMTLFPANNGSTVQGGNTQLNIGFPNTNNGNNGLAKIDYRLNARHTISGDYFIGGSTQFEEDQAVLQQPWESEAITRSQVFGVSWIWTPGTSWVNQAKFSYTRQKQLITTADSNVNPETYGIDTGVTNPRDFGMPVITVGPFYPMGGNPGWPSLQNPALNYSFADNVSYVRGNHSLKWGGELRRGSIDNIKDRFGRTRITFSQNAAFAGATGLEDFLAGDPKTGRIAVGNTQRNVSMWSYAGYFQDGWRVTPRFTLNAGLRYELTTVMKESNDLLGNFDPSVGLVQVGKQVSAPYNGDHNNFGPRLGFAWDVFGSGKTILRGGGGVMYELFPFNAFIGYFGVDNAATPGISVIPTGALGVTPGGGTIAAGTVDLPGSKLNYSGNGPVFNTSTTLNCNPNVVVGGVAGTPCSILGVNPNLRTPYVSSWNLNVQQVLTNTTTLQLGYVGNHGTKLLSVYDANQVNPQSPAEIACGHCEQAGRPYNAQFPFLAFGNILGNGYESNYDGLQVNLTEKPRHGLSFVVGYTWSHTLDQSSANRDPQPQNSLNPASEYGNSDMDIRQRFTFTATYEIPGMKTKGQLLEGWQLNSILTVQTGQPWGVIDGYVNGSDVSQTGELTDRWDFFGNPSAFSVTSTPIPYFAGSGDPTNPTSNAACNAQAQSLDGGIGGPMSTSLASLGCFVKGGAVMIPPAYGTFGTMARNLFRGPGFQEWDLSVVKAFKFGERLTAQLRGEVFNVINHPNLANPWGASGTYGNVDPTAPGSFGCGCATPDVAGANPVIGTGGARAIQVGLKFLF
jgi:hypothetical protein